MPLRRGWFTQLAARSSVRSSVRSFPAVLSRNLIFGRGFRPDAARPRLRAGTFLLGADSRISAKLICMARADSLGAPSHQAFSAVGSPHGDGLQDVVGLALGCRQMGASEIAHRRIIFNQPEFLICPDSSGRTGIRRLNRVDAGGPRISCSVHHLVAAVTPRNAT